jgi:hypothetical protein
MFGLVQPARHCAVLLHRARAWLCEHLFDFS